MEIITVECMNMKPHDAHTWREGFLWHRKRVCGGVPRTVDWDGFTPNERREAMGYVKADVESTAALFSHFKGEHRHHFKFNPEEADNVIMAWKCDVPDCEKEAFRFRSVFNHQTRVGGHIKFITKTWR